MDKIKTHSLSFKGRRENNQDNYINISLNPATNFIAIADGMGGVAGGSVASKKVLDCCEEVLNIQLVEKKTDLKQILRKIFFEAQNTIKSEVKKNPILEGMGTTLTCVLLQNGKFVWGNLGDSRIYYLSNSKLKLITKDHSHIQEFIDNKEGEITRSILDNYSNYLTRSIDGGSDEADIYPENSNFIEIQDGDVFLLCSDGLVINKAENYTRLFENFIVGTKDLEAAAEILVNWAYSNGSTDNITVVLLENGKIKRKKVKELEKIYIDDKLTSAFIKTTTSKIKFPALVFGLVSIISFLLMAILFKHPNHTLKDNKQFLKNIDSLNSLKSTETKKIDPLKNEKRANNKQDSSLLLKKKIIDAEKFSSPKDSVELKIKKKDK